MYTWVADTPQLIESAQRLIGRTREELVSGKRAIETSRRALELSRVHLKREKTDLLKMEKPQR